MTRRRVAAALSLLTACVMGLTLLTPAQAVTSTAVLPDWARTATIYEVNTRQYTPEGTFAAFERSLPRLQQLGVTMLWFMPIQPISVAKRKGSLGSPYSVADYTAVNPELGTSEDFRRLVEHAHAMGFKVILDWVANHTGWDNPWIANADWYHRDARGSIIPPNVDWTDVAWLDYANPAVGTAMIDAMKYWVTQYDVDGFRADYASGVPVEFWNRASAELQAIKPLFMLAEDQSQTALLEHAFVANYNWKLLGVLNHLASSGATAADLDDLGTSLPEYYPTGTFPMNFITNHDENAATGSEYSRMGRGVRAMSAIYFTFPGIPLIYSGQEVGSRRKLAFFDKDLIPGLTAANATSAFYARLVSLKKSNPALWNDSTAAYQPLRTRNLGVVAFARVVAGDRVVTIANVTGSRQRATIKAGNLTGQYVRFTTGTRGSLPRTYRVTLAPWQYEILSTTPA
jgi:glycosidase